MPSEFGKLMQVGMGQLLPLAGEDVTWYFGADVNGDRQSENYTGLVSEENEVERIVDGVRLLVRTRGVTFDAATIEQIVAIGWPDRRHQFSVEVNGQVMLYAFQEVVSWAVGGVTILGERIDRRETSRERMYG